MLQRTDHQFHIQIDDYPLPFLQMESNTCSGDPLIWCFFQTMKVGKGTQKRLIMEKLDKKSLIKSIKMMAAIRHIRIIQRTQNICSLISGLSYNKLLLQEVVFGPY